MKSTNKIADGFDYQHYVLQNELTKQNISGWYSTSSIYGRSEYELLNLTFYSIDDVMKFSNYQWIFWMFMDDVHVDEYPNEQ